MRQGENAVELAELDVGEYPRAMTHSRSDDDSSMVSDRLNRGRLAPSCPCRSYPRTRTNSSLLA
jgi:hypothetical protein